MPTQRRPSVRTDGQNAYNMEWVPCPKNSITSIEVIGIKGIRRLEQYVAQQSFGNAPRRVARHSSTRPAPPLAATACCKLAAAPVGWCGLTQMAPPYLSAVCARRGCRGGRAPAARRARRRQVSAGCRRGIGRHRGARHPVPQRLLSLSGCGWRGRAGCMHGNSQCTT